MGMPVKIRVKVMEEIIYPINIPWLRKVSYQGKVEWVDNNGINTPYLVTYV